MRALGFDLLAVQALNFSWHIPHLIRAANTLDLHTAHEDLRWSAAHALGTICDGSVLPALLRFGHDPDSGARLEVARGIPVGIGPLPEDAVRVLLNLMRDPDAEVRDWATMTLGGAGNDTRQIRDAFFERLADAEEDTAGEAAVALAKCHDPRILPVLHHALTMADVGNLYVEAAAELGDTGLLPLLQRLKADGWQNDEPRPHVFDEALAACASEAASA